MANAHEDAPFDGGSQPVTERPPSVPGAGRSAMQTIVLIVSALALIAAVLYMVARFSGA